MLRGMDTNTEPDGLAQLRAGLEEVRGLVLEFKTSRQPAERAEIRQELDEVEADVEALARKYGLPASTIRDSIAAAKRAERKDEMRDVVRELLEEMIDDDEADLELDDEAEVAKPVEKKDKTPRPAKIVEEVIDEDSEPDVPHWSDRSIGDLLK